MVTACRINSMDPVVGKPFMFLPTAHNVWEVVRKTYSDLENHYQMFELNTQMWRLQQGDREVTTYYNEMMALWQELNLFKEKDWESLTTFVIRKKLNEAEYSSFCPVE